MRRDQIPQSASLPKIRQCHTVSIIGGIEGGMAKKPSGGRRSQRPSKQAPSAASPGAQALPAAPPVEPPAPTSQDKETIVLRTGDQQFPLSDKSVKEKEIPFARAALQWTYIVSNRRRWSTLASLRKDKATKAEELLVSFGVD